MTKFIEKEILLHKLMPKPDQGYIKRLQQISDTNRFDIETMRDFGRLMTVKRYEELYGKDHRLPSTCHDVIRYMGGYNVYKQDGMFKCLVKKAESIDDEDVLIESESIKEIESRIWHEIIMFEIIN